MYIAKAKGLQVVEVQVDLQIVVRSLTGEKDKCAMHQLECNYCYSSPNII